MSQPIGQDSLFEISLLKQVVFNRDNEFKFEKVEKEDEKTFYFFRHKVTQNIIVLDDLGATHMPHETMGIIPINEQAALKFVYRLASNRIPKLPLETLFGTPIPSHIVHLNHTNRSLSGTRHLVTLPYRFHDEDPIFLFFNKIIEKAVWVDLDLNFYEYDRDAIVKPITISEGLDILLAKGENTKKLKEEALIRYQTLKAEAEAASERDWKKYTVLLGTRYAGSYWH
ncbi:MAG: hypothetical protein ACHQYP_12325 [Nitrospiria bacterium]